VPVEVSATGHRVIGIGARHAERVMFTLGANIDRLAWGIAEARAARQKAGLDPDGVALAPISIWPATTTWPPPGTWCAAA
jgi:5,10-methylenetetrahydromethanopterin reductase